MLSLVDVISQRVGRDVVLPSLNDMIDMLDGCLDIHQALRDGEVKLGPVNDGDEYLGRLLGAFLIGYVFGYVDDKPRELLESI